MLYSDADNKALLRKIEFSSIDDLEVVKKLDNSKALADVQAANPNGSYDFLFAGSFHFPKYSLHFFETGECFLIEYEDDKDSSVKDITPFTI